MSEATKRIAVVAIHGVGDHAQFASAREIGDLLSTLKYDTPATPAEESPRYTPFTEVMKRIHVRPVCTDKSEPSQDKTWGPMDALARSVFKGHDKNHNERRKDNSVDSLDHQFMKGQLIGYKGERPEDTYHCLRLEGKRVAPPSDSSGARQQIEPDEAAHIADSLREGGVQLPPPSPAATDKIVHIHEMYWSDLSQLGAGFTRIFGAMYQLLFHLGSVSVNNVLAAAIHFQENQKAAGKWRAFSQAQWFATAILAWPIPILNLILAAIVPVILVLSLMRAYLSPHNEFIALDALLALFAIGGTGYFLTKSSRVPAFLYPVPLLLFTGLAIAAGLWIEPWNRNRTESAVAWIAAILALTAVWQIVKVYDKQRPGSKQAAIWIGAVLGSALLACRMLISSFPMGGSEGYPAIESCLNVMEISFGFLFLAWILFYGGQIWAHFAGWRAVAAVKGKYSEAPDYVKARRTQWTARLVLALSSLVFLTVTISLWAGALKVTVGILRGQQPSSAKKPPRPSTAKPDAERDPMLYRPVSVILYRRIAANTLKDVTYGPAREVDKIARNLEGRAILISDWAEAMLNAAGIGLLPIFLAAFLLAFAVCVWALFPSMWAELFPPGSRQTDHLERQSESIGSWLDNGFRFMRFAGELLYWTMWVPALLFVILNLNLIPYVAGNSSALLIDFVGAAVAGAAVSILGFSGRLKKLTGGVRPLLRVMLDVDNWLREHPRDFNPTARICGRYVSLLRHLCAWRDSDQSQYDAIVIVAHSQGTVITADLLRFLNAEKCKAGSMDGYDPELGLLDSKQLYFFTMGCPLHQLYGLRFPFLYGWARNNIASTAPAPGKIPDIHEDEAPRPDRLGVTRWINVYRTGDYVGRYLWRGGKDSYRWRAVATAYGQVWDPPAGEPEHVSADESGSRVEFSIGPGAHTHYWDHTGELVAEVLDRMIDNA